MLCELHLFDDIIGKIKICEVPDPVCLGGHLHTLLASEECHLVDAAEDAAALSPVT